MRVDASGIDMKLDSHQHFWCYDAAQYPWIPPGSPLQRDWLPTDLAPLLRTGGLDGTIAVQARQTIEESRWLLELADRHPVIRGVVGWVDLRSESVGRELELLSSHPRFVGVRHVVQDEPDDEFMLRPEFLRGIGMLRHHGLTYDILIYPQQLPAAVELVRRFPDQPFVLDHGAKPLIRENRVSPWDSGIKALAAAPNVMCKLSGLVTEARHDSWDLEQIRPYLDLLADRFGVDRLMFGSDWPVCLLAASYPRVLELVTRWADQLPASDREKIFGGNCRRFYLD